MVAVPAGIVVVGLVLADLPAMLRGLAASLGASTVEYQDPDAYRLYAHLTDALGPGVDSAHLLYPRDGVALVFAGKT